MTKQIEMPDMDFFRTKRPAAGPWRVGITMGGLEIILAGLSEDLAARLRRRFAVYLADSFGSRDALKISVLEEDREYFIDPPETPEFNPILIRCDGERIRYMGYRVAGWFDTLGGEGRLLLSRGRYEPAERAIENYIRAAVAWQAASRGGALVHGASAVLDGKGYLFFGPSGAGKSTLSEYNTRATVISDDLTLVLPDRERRPELVGSPFRGTYEGGNPVVGRFPLVAGFRLVQDKTASVQEVKRVQVFGELVGNFPFVAEAFQYRPELFARMERAFRDVPLKHLHFTKNDSYWDAILAENF